MTIVISQLGDTVINADKIIAFGVTDTSSIMVNGLHGEITTNYSVYVNCATGSRVIGSFCIKEKAMEVLKEMTRAIQAEKDYSLPKDENLE